MHIIHTISKESQVEITIYCFNYKGIIASSKGVLPRRNKSHKMSNKSDCDYYWFYSGPDLSKIGTEAKVYLNAILACPTRSVFLWASFCVPLSYFLAPRGAQAFLLRGKPGLNAFIQK